MLTKNDLCLQIDVFLKIFFCRNLKYWLSFFANMKVLVSSVLIFLHQILSLGLKIKTFSKSTYPGLLKNVLNFNHTWLWCQVMMVQTFCKLFFYSRFTSQYTCYILRLYLYLFYCRILCVGSETVPRMRRISNSRCGFVGGDGFI